MKLKLSKRISNGITFVEADVLGAKITLSKKLVQLLKDEKKLDKSAEIETDDRMILIASAKESKNGGKPWANMYLTLRADKKEETADDDLPF